MTYSIHASLKGKKAKFEINSDIDMDCVEDNPTRKNQFLDSAKREAIIQMFDGKERDGVSFDDVKVTWKKVGEVGKQEHLRDKEFSKGEAVKEMLNGATARDVLIKG